MVSLTSSKSSESNPLALLKQLVLCGRSCRSANAVQQQGVDEATESTAMRIVRFGHW